MKSLFYKITVAIREEEGMENGAPGGRLDSSQVSVGRCPASEREHGAGGGERKKHRLLAMEHQ